MRTNIEIDDQLVSKAMRSSGVRTKKAVVEAGLRLFVKTHSHDFDSFERYLGLGVIHP